ncbi:hypothetical protein GCM10007096_17670 [Pullulanibacillus pueri]|uniref:Uncharacterized protein n=1 Tax=Pullulanibacillus pueri TaxID=1437324 RepID=A0A8J2ZV33_9BACL|nr:hypothetical protein GCM10007096_17670 [Pullulanibacillus pueri]
MITSLLIAMYLVIGSVFSTLMFGLKRRKWPMEMGLHCFLFTSLLLFWLPISIVSFIIGPFIKQYWFESHS